MDPCEIIFAWDSFIKNHFLFSIKEIITYPLQFHLIYTLTWQLFQQGCMTDCAEGFTNVDIVNVLSYIFVSKVWFKRYISHGLY